MKKLTLSVGLIASLMCSKAQDTIEIAVTPKYIFEWDNKYSIKPSKEYEYIGSFFIEIGENEVLCLWLYDKENKTREVIMTFPSGFVRKNVFNSKNNKYFSPIGPLKVEVKQ